MSHYTKGQTHQLVDAMEAAGFTAEHLTKLGQSKDLSKVKDFLDGKAQITYPQHLIDCDANPYVPDGWSVEEYAKGGQLLFDITKVKLWLSKAQTKGNVIEGNKLRKELKSQPVLNANVLDFLLAHPELIPDEWKGKAVFFWGTIYRDSNGDLCVRCLCWHDGRWGWRINGGWLDNDFLGSFPAAVSASN